MMSQGARLICCEAADALDTKDAENAALKAENHHLQTQAECWAMEARAHKSSLHEAYQAVTGATGEPGNWNGAAPIVACIAELRAQVASLTEQRDAAINTANLALSAHGGDHG
jgi:hypothetical protein